MRQSGLKLSHFWGGFSESNMPKPQRVRPQDPLGSIEVAALRTRRRRLFSAGEKQRILALADACVHGELGALLRREGIYHSHLIDWRAKLAESGVAGLAPCTPGPVPKFDAKDREILALNSKVKKLERELVIVNGLVELQKKVQAMFSAMQKDDAP